MSDDPVKVPRFEESEGFYTTPQRSKIMSRIKAKATKPEITLRKELYRCGFRYRVNYSKLPGKPDIVNKSLKLAVFIDGEFWHGYQWEKKKDTIKSNRAFWIPKIERNMQRDQENNKKLESLGYTVLRFWEHELKKDLNACVRQIMDEVGKKRGEILEIRIKFWDKFK